MVLFALNVGGGTLGLIVLVLDIVAIFGLIKGGASTNHKVLWIVLILLFPLLGVLLYFFIGRSSRDG